MRYSRTRKNQLFHGLGGVGMSVLTYGPGETVPHPGVYAVIHGKPHTQYKELFVERGTFPSCQVCSAQVTFRLLSLIHI